MIEDFEKIYFKVFVESFSNNSKGLIVRLEKIKKQQEKIDFCKYIHKAINECELFASLSAK